MTRLNKISIYSLVVVSSLLSIASSAEIYKHVDKQGVVTYSDVKPIDATEDSVVKVTPSDTASNVFDSEERSENQQASKDFFEKREKIRVEQAEKSAALTKWRKQLKAAELELKRAKQAKSNGIVAGPGDYVGSALGGARPSEKFFKKVEQLDTNIVIAKQKVATIRQQKPR